MDDLYASLYEHVGCAVVRVRGGVVQFANPVAARLLLARPREHLPHPLLDDLFKAVERRLIQPPLRFELSLLARQAPDEDRAAPRRGARPFNAVLVPAPWYEDEYLLVLSSPDATAASNLSHEFLTLSIAGLQKSIDEVLRLSYALAEATSGSLVQRLHAHALDTVRLLGKMRDFAGVREPPAAEWSERLLLEQLVQEAVTEIGGASSHSLLSLSASPHASPAVYGHRLWLRQGMVAYLRHAARLAERGSMVQVFVGAAGPRAFVKATGLRRGGEQHPSLDLLLARRVAEVHGGSLLLEAGEPPDGAELLLELPSGAPPSGDPQHSLEQAARYDESRPDLHDFTRRRC